MYIFNSKFPGGFQANNDDVLSHLKKETQSERALKSSGRVPLGKRVYSFCFWRLSLKDPRFPRIPDLASFSLPLSHDPGLICHTIVLKSYQVTCRLI